VTDATQEKIECRICGAKVHVMKGPKGHLAQAHPGVDEQDYLRTYPGAPLLSLHAEDLLRKRAAEKAAAEAAAAPALATAMAGSASLAMVGGTSGAPATKAFHELFGFGTTVREALGKSGGPIPIKVLNVVGPDSEMVPALDPNHVFDVELTKNICLGLEFNIPIYAYGPAGVGKTTGFLQVAAHTGRPTLRVQHTINTEEAHIIGQWIVKNGQTEFQLGPLAQAMLNGWLYIADEYDFALPAVLAVYQPVLEGNPLVIKDAPPEHRVIKPHPNFRMVASGNTNGTGDETGAYQGTQLQNAANYERFGIVVRVHYMEKAQEVKAIVQQSRVGPGDAEKLVDFAHRIREAHDGHTMSSTISPRSLIYAAKLGIVRGSMMAGLTVAFLNRLSSVDREAAKQVAERIFK
jgi:cobaltochelatase CobS